MSKTNFAQLEIPLPPLNEQERIVAELGGYRKIIEGARQVIANYKPTIQIDPTWPRLRLGEIAEVNRSTVDPAAKYGEKEFVYIDISSVENGTGKIAVTSKVRGVDAPSRARRVVTKGDVLLSTVRPNLKAFAYFDEGPDDVVASTGFAVLTPDITKILGRFIWYLLFEEEVLSQMLMQMGKGAYPSINQSDVEALQIPVPSLSIQGQIVAELDAERPLLESNRKLIEIFEAKIKAKLDEIWGEEKQGTSHREAQGQ